MQRTNAAGEKIQAAEGVSTAAFFLSAVSPEYFRKPFAGQIIILHPSPESGRHRQSCVLYQPYLMIWFAFRTDEKP